MKVLIIALILILSVIACDQIGVGSIDLEFGTKVNIEAADTPEPTSTATSTTIIQDDAPVNNVLGR